MPRPGIEKRREIRDCPQTISGLDSTGLFDELSLDEELAYAEGAIGNEATSERSQKGPEDDPLRVCGQSLRSSATEQQFIKNRFSHPRASQRNMRF